jgi:biotin operon repressor
MLLHAALQRQPVASAAALGNATGLTPATVNKTIAHLQRLGMVDELTERQRGRIFAYRNYVTLLSAELYDAPDKLSRSGARLVA